MTLRTRGLICVFVATGLVLVQVMLIVVDLRAHELTPWVSVATLPLIAACVANAVWLLRRDAREKVSNQVKRKGS